MKGFINVTRKEDGSRRLVSTSRIVSVYETKTGKAFIEMQSMKYTSYGIETAESYNEVVSKIEEASR